MSSANQSLLDALLDSWNRNNAILVNLLELIPEDRLTVKGSPDSPSIMRMFNHIHYCRMVFLSEDAPEFASEIPAEEWRSQCGRAEMAAALHQSARAVRDAVKSRIETDRPMNLHYDHPVLFLQHMIWHEGYHHGQIKLALKTAGAPLSDDEAGPLTWDIWMDKTDPRPAKNL